MGQQHQLYPRERPLWDLRPEPLKRPTITMSSKTRRRTISCTNTIMTLLPLIVYATIVTLKEGVLESSSSSTLFVPNVVAAFHNTNNVPWNSNHLLQRHQLKQSLSTITSSSGFLTKSDRQTPSLLMQSTTKAVSSSSSDTDGKSDHHKNSNNSNNNLNFRSNMNVDTIDMVAYENKNKSRQKFGLQPLSIEEYLRIEHEIEMLVMQRQRDLDSLQMENLTTNEPSVMEKMIGSVLFAQQQKKTSVDTCESNSDCVRPKEVCCDYIFTKKCCTGGSFVDQMNRKNELSYEQQILQQKKPQYAVIPVYGGTNRSNK